MAARRAAIFTTEQAPATFDRVLVDLAAWDGLPGEVSPKQVGQAITAGLSAAEAASVHAEPTGPARFGVLAALLARLQARDVLK